MPTPRRLLTRVNDAVGRGQLAPPRGMLIAVSRRGGSPGVPIGADALRGVAAIGNGDCTDGEF